MRFLTEVRNILIDMLRVATSGLVVVAVALSCATTSLGQVNQPGVSLTVSEIEAIANRVRAGRSLQPTRWPDGARVAVLISLDVDNDTISIARNEVPSIGAMSQGEYGGRVGLERVVDLLDQFSIPATFFIPAVSLILQPQMVEVIQEAGHHEFGVHGWIHELNTSLPAETERELVIRATDYLEQVTGRRPVGYRAPSWNFSPNTLNIVREQGFLYDSSLMADDRPYELMQNGEPTGIVELPVEWIKDDAPYMSMDRRGTARPHTSPFDVLDIFKAEFDGAYTERGLCLITMHPHVIGHRSRMRILDGLIDHIKGHDGVWFGTHEEVARYCLENA